MTDRVRVALVGCGRIAQVAHLPALEKANGIELVAVCDPSEHVALAVAARYGIDAVHIEAKEVFADPGVEAVLIAAPDRFHFDLVEDALEAGKHVLIEKPIASTVEQAARLVEMVAAAGVTLQVGSMKRHDPGLQFTRRFVREKVGEVRSFNAWYRIGSLRPGIEATLFPRTFDDPAARKVEAEFKSDRERYLLATHGSHVFDTVRYLLGEVRSVTATHRGFGRDHVWNLLVTMASGAIGTATITVDVPGDGAEGIQVFGSLGHSTTHTHFPFFRRASDVLAYSSEDGLTVSPVPDDTDAYERQAEAFASAVRGEASPDPDAADGLAAVRLIDAVQRSVTSGSEVEL
ncbi:Gfo/Idh/MocA family protein [Pseudonocardia sp. GCM10023141]|uniref:Gfo/Idh/MocA family protein n=1 Tax=Pseudonocardia sp. GCM10023141 TaxID=3252653 RepID=UPI00360A440A